MGLQEDTELDKTVYRIVAAASRSEASSLGSLTKGEATNEIVDLVKSRELQARLEELNAVPMNEVRRLSDYRFERREELVAELNQLKSNGIEQGEQ